MFVRLARRESRGSSVGRNMIEDEAFDIAVPGSEAGVGNNASLETPALSNKEMRVLSTVICESSVGTTNPFFRQ